MMSTMKTSHIQTALYTFYIPMWLLNGNDSCNDNGFDDEIKFWSGGRALNLSISLLLLPLFIVCSEFIACGQPIVGSRGTGRKICCHLSGVIQSFWNASLCYFSKTKKKKRKVQWSNRRHGKSIKNSRLNWHVFNDRIFKNYWLEITKQEEIENILRQI